MNIRAVFTASRGKREVVEIFEPKKADRRLDGLVGIRKRRIDRYEREKVEARRHWRDARQEMREAKLGWREAKQAATEFWREARADFLRIAITSGEFRKAKAIFERMKAHAAEMHLKCGEAVAAGSAARCAFFDAAGRLRQAHREHEKLSLLREEIKIAERQKEG